MSIPQKERKDPRNLGRELTVSSALFIFLNYRRGNLGVRALREVGYLFKATCLLSGRAWIQIQTSLKSQIMLILFYQMFLPFLTIVSQTLRNIFCIYINRHSHPASGGRRLLEIIMKHYIWESLEKHCPIEIECKSCTRFKICW